MATLFHDLAGASTDKRLADEAAYALHGAGPRRQGGYLAPSPP